jgi:hypothetical protein
MDDLDDAEIACLTRVFQRLGARLRADRPDRADRTDRTSHAGRAAPAPRHDPEPTPQHRQ